MRTGGREALDAGHRLLVSDARGTQEQFSDSRSTQICKYGWGSAVMQLADRTVSYEEPLLRMGEWFIDRQQDDGSWAPSGFLSPNPTVAELMMKTAEHVMEVNAVIAALAMMRDGFPAQRASDLVAA